jgi:hypothetical protein
MFLQRLRFLRDQRRIFVFLDDGGEVIGSAAEPVRLWSQTEVGLGLEIASVITLEFCAEGFALQET